MKISKLEKDVTDFTKIFKPVGPGFPNDSVNFWWIPRIDIHTRDPPNGLTVDRKARPYWLQYLCNYSFIFFKHTNPHFSSINVITVTYYALLFNIIHEKILNFHLKRCILELFWLLQKPKESTLFVFYTLFLRRFFSRMKSI